MSGDAGKPEYIPSPALDVCAWLKSNGAAREEAAFITAYLKLDPKKRAAALKLLDEWRAAIDAFPYLGGGGEEN